MIEQRVLPADFHPAELGEVVLGTATGRLSPDGVTFFKSVGNAVQDLYCATEVLRRAEQEGVGTMIAL